MTELPEGWRVVPLIEAADVTLGQSPPGDSYNDTGDGTPFFQGKTEFTRTYAEVRKYTTAGTKFAKAGDILISVRAPVGPTNLAPVDCAIGRGLAALRAKNGVDHKYLQWAMRATEHELAAHGAGTTFPAITGKELRAHPIALPPSLDEQRRIVAILEDHLSRLDAADAYLDAARRRGLVLHTQLLEAELAAVDSEEIAFADLLKIGLANGKSVPTQDGGFPVLRLTALRGGRIDLGERKNGAWTAADASRFLVRRGDFLISRGNGSLRLMGRGGLVSDEPDPVAFPDTLIRARPDTNRITSEFLALVWNAPGVRRQIEKAAKTTAGIYKINQKDLNALLVTVPSVEDQGRLVDSVLQSREALMDLTMQTARGAKRSAALRRSLLTAAFSGRLTAASPDPVLPEPWATGELPRRQVAA